MILRTHVRDCLYLNWALPAERMPAPPDPLRYDVRESDGEAVVFASALFFRQNGLQLTSVPFPRVDAPQFQLHLCTLDADGVPSVLIRAVLVPGWFAPGARWVTRQPARAARLVYPASIAAWTPGGGRCTRAPGWGAPGWSSREKSGHLFGSRPDLGTWDQTVSFFRRRGLGFTETLRGPRRVEIERTQAAVTPIRATVAENDLLLHYLAELEPIGLPALHSAWLCAPMKISTS